MGHFDGDHGRHDFEHFIACVAGVKRGRGNLGARGRKERNACKDVIVFSIFQVQILSVKIVVGQN